MNASAISSHNDRLVTGSPCPWTDVDDTTQPISLPRGRLWIYPVAASENGLSTRLVVRLRAEGDGLAEGFELAHVVDLAAFGSDPVVQELWSEIAVAAGGFSE
jgi:hypothetical protein